MHFRLTVIDKFKGNPDVTGQDAHQVIDIIALRLRGL